ncbi:peptidyl-prolyl cis-trans isomerase CYP37, chloroplastic isoform X2 [Asparagus officinalis]|uniref:peptidyl-prolyl cis-trans isomerase CYP37, chloroplastic isoform X2 n=1 Tax=Asparagus officinalis TaxID=4686 RepID=UPI00098E06FC|nr:peptidyl-prolyl cis-trans isomerase CYP37, chloroplastic isoform X2 [Asparagus officinalis]
MAAPPLISSAYVYSPCSDSNSPSLLLLRKKEKNPGGSLLPPPHYLLPLLSTYCRRRPYYRNRAQQHPAERSIGIRTSRKHLPFPGGFSDAEENNLLQPMLLDLIRRLAGGGAIASILVSQFLAPLNNSAANAVLYSPDTKVPRTGELALRRAIPANSNVKAIQIAIKEKESILGSVPEDFKERGSLLYTSLIDGKGALQNLIQAIKENDPDKVSVSLASSLDTLAEIELLQAPGLSFLLPEQYLKYPRLTGRGTVEFTIEKDAGTAFFPIAGGQPQSLAKIQVILDGYSAPLTTGNFAKLVLDGAYDGARLKCTDQAVLVDSKLENSGYSVPLEVMPSGQFEPLYKTTLSIQDGELPVLPLSVYGSVAMAHSTDSEEYSSPSQFFFYLYDKRNAGLGGLSFDEGQFSVFGYTTIGREVLSQIKSGDLIRSAKLVEGRDRLMLPAETNQKLS